MVDEQDKKEVSLHSKKLRLRMLYKYYKVGRIDAVLHTITPEERIALRKYYGVEL